ncbi:FMN-dependent NADH-azoreductase [Dyadobacter soli]|uniref:FMN dependent NADH:quinone oxidoreductase n=1 Tax=Dyadobacter soli TaxID=659014 RepID=A0A1G7PSH5_9BACT|nr:NAD(P)H-dependent oxidoreductase [Dyadobacter soli]SDF89181.1 FMN-dependent NADH-azoreductase [Dyadobacter soli]
MKQLLVINSSARIHRSHSRGLTDAFVGHWQQRHPDSSIIFREIGNVQVPHIDEKWITAAFKPAAARSGEDLHILETSDAFVAELKRADVIVIGSPMYNWSIPSPLKAYIDQVMRIHETWRPDPSNQQNPYAGLLHNKTLILLLATGAAGYGHGEYNQHMDHQSSYLKMMFNIMGINDIHIISINGISTAPDELPNAIEHSTEQIKALINRN